MNKEINKIQNFDDLLSNVDEVDVKNIHNTNDIGDYLIKNDLITNQYLSSNKKVEIFCENLKNKPIPQDITLLKTVMGNFEKKLEKIEKEVSTFMLIYTFISCIFLGYFGFKALTLQSNLSIMVVVASLIILCSLGYWFYSALNKKNQIESTNEINKLEEEYKDYELTQAEYIFLKSKTSDENFNKFLAKKLLKKKEFEETLYYTSSADWFYDSNWQKDFVGKLYKKYMKKTNSNFVDIENNISE